MQYAYLLIIKWSLIQSEICKNKQQLQLVYLDMPSHNSTVTHAHYVQKWCVLRTHYWD